jgi:hypothetical protein
MKYLLLSLFAVLAFSNLTLADVDDEQGQEAPETIQGERALQIYYSLPGSETPTYDPDSGRMNGSFKEGNGMYCWKSVRGSAYCEAL